MAYCRHRFIVTGAETDNCTAIASENATETSSTRLATRFVVQDIETESSLEHGGITQVSQRTYG